jgi:epsilon-lactone hydrolase
MDMRSFKRRLAGLGTAMNAKHRLLQAGLCFLLVYIALAPGWAQENTDISRAPLSPEVSFDADGTIHLGARTIPFPTLASAQAKEAYLWLLKYARDGQPTDPQQFVKWFADHVPMLFAHEKAAALRTYPVMEEDQKIAGVDVTVYIPMSMPAANKNKVIFEFEVDATAIAIANLTRTKVMAVHYGGAQASLPQQIVAVYREILRTHRPKDVALFGTSGGCALAHSVTQWLPEQKLPFPAAVGLLSCTGRTDPGDTQTTNNGLDPYLSAFLFPTRPSGRIVDISNPNTPGEPARTPLDGDIPKGYPPAYLLSGTRDMCLSEIVLLHRKLHNAGVEAELHVFEGMWHGFQDDTDVPEAREALTDLAHFLTAHMEK